MMKTKKSAAKRFRVTGTGKIKIKKANMKHMMRRRSSDLKRKKRQAGYVHPSDMNNVKYVIPYQL